jgi:TolB-like protein/cytochrome c-type biogenesis protein CcmH/NrfG
MLRARVVPLVILLSIFAAVVIAIRMTSDAPVVTTDTTSHDHDPSDAVPHRSVVVVLPFENLGNARDTFFAAGVSDEIATRLASISSIGVISRTTAARYANTAKSIADIGEELGVDYVLEGSVRWDHAVRGSRVRIAPRLIRVSDDTQLWSGQYDRHLENVFDVQSDVAAQVVRQLNLRLRAEEQRAVAGILTDNFAAYEAYLHGKEAAKRSYGERDARETVTWFAKAVALDPSFATAWAQLSIAHAYLYHVGFDRSPARLEQAKRALDRAKAIDPDLPLVHLAAGYFHYWGYLDYPRASSELALAWKALPNDSDVIQAIAFVRRRQGDFEEASQNLKDAQVIDPQNVRLALAIGQTQLTLRHYGDAAEAYNRAIELAPNQSLGYAGRVETAWMSGDSLDAAANLIAKLPKRDDENTIGLQYRQVLYRRDFTAALRILGRTRVKEFLLLHIEQAYLPKELLVADAYALRGDVAAARQSYEASRLLLERAVANRPDDASLRSALGLTYAGLGDKRRAIEEATRAVELLPVAKDALSGAERILDLAKVLAHCGEKQQAIDRLQSLLAMPSLVSPAMLKLDPAWDSLRGEETFRALLQ